MPYLVELSEEGGDFHEGGNYTLNWRRHIRRLSFIALNKSLIVGPTSKLETKHRFLQNKKKTAMKFY